MADDADRTREAQDAFRRANSARYAARGAMVDAREMAQEAVAARDSADPNDPDEANIKALDAVMSADRAAHACAYAVAEAVAAYGVVAVPELAAIVAEAGRLLADSFDAARTATQAYYDIPGTAPVDES